MSVSDVSPAVALIWGALKTICQIPIVATTYDASRPASQRPVEPSPARDHTSQRNRVMVGQLPAAEGLAGMQLQRQEMSSRSSVHRRFGQLEPAWLLKFCGSPVVQQSFRPSVQRSAYAD